MRKSSNWKIVANLGISNSWRIFIGIAILLAATHVAQLLIFGNGPSGGFNLADIIVLPLAPIFAGCAIWIAFLAPSTLEDASPLSGGIDLQFEVSGDHEKVASDVETALSACAVVFRRDKEHGDVWVGITPISFRSCGEIVRVGVRPNGNSNFEVCVASKSILSSTIIDFGKNRSNIESIKSLILSQVNLAPD